jgi:hypothetical protein
MRAMPLVAMALATLLSTDAHASACPGPPDVVVAQNRTVVVTGQSVEATGKREFTNLVGCMGGRGSALTDVRKDEFADQPIRLTGSWVAFGVNGFAGDAFYIGLKVVRLSAVGDRPRAVYLDRTGCEACVAFTDAEVTVDGTVVWIARRGGAYTVEFCARSTCRQPQVLDRGRRVAPRSLRLRGATATWRHGSGKRRALLR